MTIRTDLREVGFGLEYQPEYVRNSLEPIKNFCIIAGGIFDYRINDSGPIGWCTFPYKRGVVSVRVYFPDEERARSTYRTGKILRMDIEARSEKYGDKVYEVTARIHGESKVVLREANGEICLGVGALSPKEFRGGPHYKSIYICVTDTDKLTKRDATIRVIDPLKRTIYTPNQLEKKYRGELSWSQPGYQSAKITL